MGNQSGNGLLGKIDLSGLKSVFLDLAGQQVTLGNLDLLLMSVSGQTDYLHSVEQGGRNGIGHVGGSDKHDPGEIHRQIEIMVGKFGVLGRIEDLK